jgi:hypothetical protein
VTDRRQLSKKRSSVREMLVERLETNCELDRVSTSGLINARKDVNQMEPSHSAGTPEKMPKNKC